MGTSAQPLEFSLPGQRRAELKSRFPSDQDSRRVRWWTLLFPVTSPGFAGLLACYLVLGIWLLHLSSSMIAVLPAAYNEAAVRPLLDMFAQTPINAGGVRAVADSISDTLGVEPLEIVYYLLFVAGMLAFARSGHYRTSKRFSWVLPEVIHAVLQLTLGILIIWAVARNFAHFEYGLGDAPPVFAVLAVAGLCIVFLNGILLGAYLIVSNILVGIHEQEVFSCQALTAYKSFLRIHVTKEHVTIYPVGLRHSNRKWKTAPSVKMLWSIVKPPYFSRIDDLEYPDGAQRLYDPTRQLDPQLIEDPIIVE